MAELIEWGTGTLRELRDLTPDIRLFTIAPPPGFLPPTPGSHVHFLVPIGERGGERTDVRSYSTVGVEGDGLCRVAVKKLPDSRGGSAYMWKLGPGARLTMSATPRNRFELSRDRPDYLLVAGGIGITPLYGMALALADAGARFRLLYGVQTEADAAFAAELRARIGERLEVVAGHPVDLPAAIAALLPGGEMYVCGPIGMLEAAKRAWAASGRPAADLRFETFGNSGRHAAEPFTVHIPRLGLRVDVPRNVTMLDALERAGVEMIYDCRRGECGLCTLPVLGADGIVDHRDVFFSDEEHAANTHLCTCVSRVAGGSVTLDTGDRRLRRDAGL